MADIEIVVARALLSGGVDLSPEAEGAVTVKDGRVIVKFPWHYEEVLKEKDDFAVLLRSSLNGKSVPDATFRHEDREGLTDDRRGVLQQTYPAPGPGEHRLTYEAVVRTDISAWDGTDHSTAAKKVAGELLLQVE